MPCLPAVIADDRLGAFAITKLHRKAPTLHRASSLFLFLPYQRGLEEVDRLLLHDMFSSKFARIAHRAPITATNLTNSSSCTAAQRTTPCLACGPTHQRRPSSSKASCPPDSSKPAPAAKTTAASQGASQSPASAPTQPQRGAKRVSRTKRFHNVPVKSKAPANQWAGLPAVPALQHRTEKGEIKEFEAYDEASTDDSMLDFSLASFFSLHRPLSPTCTIPPPASMEAFRSIFETQHEHDSWENGNSAERRPEDMIYTLHHNFDNFDGGAGSSQEDGVRWEVLQESPSNSEGGVKHLDGPPRRRTMDELVAPFRPFHAPPPPQAFSTERKSAPVERKRIVRQPKQKHYETTIRVTETTTADGQRTYSAIPSPIVRIPDPEEQAKLSYREPPSQQIRIRQPFLERMRKRQQLYLQAHHSKVLEHMDEPRAVIRRAPSHRRPQMLLISVKRQRKLKMKKHKYKKLMRRTRNLRRRLDRA